MKKSMDKLMKFLMTGLFVVAGMAVNSTCCFKLYLLGSTDILCS